jgi:hypothetical protein
MNYSNFFLADDYARINCEALIRGADPGSLNSAVAMWRLALLWARNRTALVWPEKGEGAAHLAKRSHQIVLTKRDLPVMVANVFHDALIDVWSRTGHLTDETRTYQSLS